MSLDQVFHALSDPTRRAILERLSAGEATVGELAQPFAMTQPAISHHLKVLSSAGLVVMTRDGRLTRCRLEPARLREAGAWAAKVEGFWTGRVAQLRLALERLAITAEADGPDGEAADGGEEQVQEAGDRGGKRPRANQGG